MALLGIKIIESFVDLCFVLFCSTFFIQLIHTKKKHSSRKTHQERNPRSIHIFFDTEENFFSYALSTEVASTSCRQKCTYHIQSFFDFHPGHHVVELYHLPALHFLIGIYFTVEKTYQTLGSNLALGYFSLFDFQICLQRQSPVRSSEKHITQPLYQRR